MNGADGRLGSASSRGGILHRYDFAGFVHAGTYFRPGQPNLKLLITGIRHAARQLSSSCP